MKSRAEAIYLGCPLWLQNIVISLYGLKREHICHGGKYRNYYDNVISHFNYGDLELNEYVNSKFRAIVKDAVEYVPYYRQLFHKLGITSEDIRSVEDLPKIPLLQKETVRKHPHSLISEKYKKTNLLTIHTTGTTGTPLKVLCDRRVRQLNYAFFDRFLELAGINYRGRKATFGGRVVVPPAQCKPPFWRYSYFQKNLLFSSYHLTDNNIPYYIHSLSKFRPDYIDSYPSSLATIADYAQKHNISLNHITRGIITSGETLEPDQREMIETTFGAPVFDQYGCAEMCAFAGQCREGRYHIHMDYGILEVLREDGSRVKPGEEGELVCTGLINPVMPLIRYRIGDRGILSASPCKCGSPFPVMEKVLGRMDDFILTPDGRKIGRLSPVLKGFPVKEAQYIQEKIDELIVLIVQDVGFNPQIDSHVIKELQKRVGTRIAVRIKYVDKIERSAGGKFRSIISKLD